MCAAVGSKRQTEGEMALPLSARRGKTGWQEPWRASYRQKPALLELDTLWRQNSAMHSRAPVRSAGAETERWFPLIWSVTLRQTWGIIFITSGILTVSVSLEVLKYSQSVWYYDLMMSHGSNQWVWEASKMALKKLVPSDSSSGLEPESRRQTHKWRIMIINTPIRHLLCFQGCFENNVFTIKRRAQMSKEAHIIPLNGQRSTGFQVRVRLGLWLFCKWRPGELVILD